MLKWKTQHLMLSKVIREGDFSDPAHFSDPARIHIPIK